MNENWDYQPEEPNSGNSGRRTFIIVLVLGMLLVAGVLFWALTRNAGPTTTDNGGSSATWVAILPALLGGSIAATRRRREGTSPANYAVPTLIIALVILLIIGVGLAVGFGVI